MTAPSALESSATIVDAKREVKRCPECAQRFGADARFCPFDGTMLTSEAWDPGYDSRLGTVVDGRYELCAVLGEGGMGTVYKVRHAGLDRMFAMKVLRKDLARDKDLALRFTQEARATASIMHPNVVQITDFGHLPDDVPYFVMELLVGQPLSAAVKEHGPLPRAMACEVILKIAAALGAAHDAGIVHRDLKPENVFLVGRASRGSFVDDVRVVDFGAAKIMGTSRITKTGIVFGTPHFMSPEQASGGVVDHRADIYALGIIMYEVFTGRVPFEADTYMGVLTQHMFVQPAPPSTVSPLAKDLGALEGIILRALEKKPEARFSSMEALAAEIRNIVRAGSSAHPPMVRDGPPSRAPRDPLELIRTPEEHTFDHPPGRQRGGTPAWLYGILGGALAGGGALCLWLALRAEARVILAPMPSSGPSALAVPVANAAQSRPIVVVPPAPLPAVSSPSAPQNSPPAQAVVRRATSPRPAPSPEPSGPRGPAGATRPAGPRGDPEFADPWKKTP